MERKFRIKTVAQPSHWIHFHLQGDFDGTSAHELANRVSRCIRDVSGIAIDTDQLRSINPFGLDVFINRLKLLGQSGRKVDFTGRFGTVFRQEQSC